MTNGTSHTDMAAPVDVPTVGADLASFLMTVASFKQSLRDQSPDHHDLAIEPIGRSCYSAFAMYIGIDGPIFGVIEVGPDGFTGPPLLWEPLVLGSQPSSTLTGGLGTIVLHTQFDAEFVSNLIRAHVRTQQTPDVTEAARSTLDWMECHNLWADLGTLLTDAAPDIDLTRILSRHVSRLLASD